MTRFVHVLVLAEGAGLPQHGVDERGLAVVDVGHDGHVADVVAGGHGVRHSGIEGGKGSGARIARPAPSLPAGLTPGHRATPRQRTPAVSGV